MMLDDLRECTPEKRWELLRSIETHNRGPPSRVEASMTDGKLVRDLIPNIIRKEGGQPEVRCISGTELVQALAANLCEEAQEVANAVGHRG